LSIKYLFTCLYEDHGAILITIIALISAFPSKCSLSQNTRIRKTRTLIIWLCLSCGLGVANHFQEYETAYNALKLVTDLPATGTKQSLLLGTQSSTKQLNLQRLYHFPVHSKYASQSEEMVHMNTVKAVEPFVCLLLYFISEVPR
jgi:hypothetical protein